MKITDKYMEEARRIADPAQSWSYVQWAVFLSARDERIRAEAKAEAFEEAAREVGMKAFTVSRETAPGLTLCAVYLEAKAKKLRAGMGEK